LGSRSCIIDGEAVASKLPKEEVGKIVRQMQSESKAVDFIAAKE